MITTNWIEYDEQGQRYRIRAEYGFSKCRDEEAHLSVTGEVQFQRKGRWYVDSFGQLHDELSEHFPKLRPLFKWHLSYYRTGPLYYVSNAQYFARQACDMLAALYEARRPHDPDPRKAFANTVVLGAVEGDNLDVLDRNYENFHKLNEAVAAWCMTRFEALMKAFAADCRACGVRLGDGRHDA